MRLLIAMKQNLQAERPLPDPEVFINAGAGTPPRSPFAPLTEIKAVLLNS